MCKRNPTNNVKFSSDSRRFSFAVALTVIVAVLFSLPAPRARADNPPLKDVQKQIQRDGKLPGGAAYWARLTAARNHAKVVRPALSFARRGALTGSMLAEVGDHPSGFGQGFEWDRRDAEIMLVLFVNAADNSGISIDGLRKGDQIQVVSASGIATFSEDNGNPLAGSLVGLVAAGAKVGADVLGLPEIGPVLDAGEKFAEEQFKGTGKGTKPRDAYGEEPGTGTIHREEGGILVALPEAGCTYYSGDGDHKERWIKDHGPRYDRIRPDHVKYGYFIVRSDPAQNSRFLNGDGPVYIQPWDWKFDDNAGYYKVFVHIKRGDSATPPPPDVIEKTRKH